MQLNHLEDWMQELRPHLVAFCAAFGALAGAGTYFTLPFEPFWGWAVAAVGLGMIGLFFAKQTWHQGLGIGIIIAGLAFVSGEWAVRSVTPVDYVAARKPHWIVGTVSEIVLKDEKPNRATLRLKDVESYGLGDGEITGASIGVFRNQLEGVEVGSDVALPAVLMAPEGPMFKGQRDGRLWSYFNGGRVAGYVLGTVEPTWRAEAKRSYFERFLIWNDGLRRTIYEQTKGMAGGALAALLVGEEKGIGRELREAYRVTGLSHLLAISGMQMTLVALGIFGLVRWLGALVPWVALNINVRLYAALLALGGTVIYTFLAGASVSLVRASIMAGIVMVAVVAGRMGNALRAWCAAVVLIVLVNPVMVTRAGFLLSIAAVLGLLLLAVAESRRKAEGQHGLMLWSRELVLATVVAGCMTAPVLVAYFGQFSVMGMMANLVAVPVMTLATYLGMVALLVWPLGLEHWVLMAMAAVVDGVNAWALWLAKLDFVSVTIDRQWWWAIGGFALVTVGAVLLNRKTEAAVGLVSMTAIALVIAVTTPKPDVMVWADGRVGWLRNGEEYRLMWAESKTEALRLAKVAGLRVEPLGEEDEIPAQLDEHLMPVTEYEHFAWAEKAGGRWRVEPLKCARVWERLAGECWED